MSQEREPGTAQRLALHGSHDHSYQAYNEPAFRHFLEMERARAVRVGGSLLLMLIEMKTGRQGSEAIQPAIADRLFAAVHRCVREIDFIGWHRVDRVIGAVLTQGSDVTSPEMCREIGERVAASLGEQVPGDLRGCVQVRVFQLRTSPKG